MDTKLIKQFGTDIGCYRIRTARQKIRMQYEDFDKQLIAISKERHVLYKIKYRPELEPLEPPVQRGWKRFFVLKDDVAGSRDALFYEGILKSINTEDWSYRKDFKIKQRRHGRKKLVVKKQELKKLTEWEFSKLNFNEQEKRCFYAEFFYNRWRRRFELFYVFSEPWRFVLRVRPNMLEWKKKTDPLKESRLQKIDNYIDRNYLYGRMVKAIYGSDHQDKSWRNKPALNILKNKSLNQVLDMVSEE